MASDEIYLWRWNLRLQRGDWPDIKSKRKHCPFLGDSRRRGEDGQKVWIFTKYSQTEREESEYANVNVAGCKWCYLEFHVCLLYLFSCSAGHETYIPGIIMISARFEVVERLYQFLWKLWFHFARKWRGKTTPSIFTWRLKCLRTLRLHKVKLKPSLHKSIIKFISTNFVNKYCSIVMLSISCSVFRAYMLRAFLRNLITHLVFSFS